MIADDPPGTPQALGGYKMIAGLWEDLDFRNSKRADAGVYFGALVQVACFRRLLRVRIQLYFVGRVCPVPSTAWCVRAAIRSISKLNCRQNGTIKTSYG